jgi:hybrid cluster-associated redox disulfide protein
MKEKKFVVTEDTLIGDVIRNKPEAIELLFKSGLRCVGCSMSHMESIKQGCIVHGMSKKDIEKLIEEINKIK